MMWHAITLTAVAPSLALDNGVGLTPLMGYSSWSDMGSRVNEAHMKKTAQYFINSGLKAKGYNYMNIDEGWMLGRDPRTLEPVEDTNLFPSGMKGFGDWVHDMGFKYGLYTSRGDIQCTQPEYRDRCLHGGPNPPACPDGEHHSGEWCGCGGSQGYEVIDGQYMVNAGADFIKEDSCGGSTNHSEAFAEYARMRDILNSTGRPVWFSVCGWAEWYAPPDETINYEGGASLGNSWRIHGDGNTWSDLSNAVNTMATLTKYHGPGGWNDPDLLIGPVCRVEDTVCGQTDLQARTQFTLWSMFPAPLLISQNVLKWSDYALETYSNEEVIALDQEPNSLAAVRIAGDDLSYPCNTSVAGTTCTNVWGRQLRSGGALAIAMVNNGDSACEITCDTSCLGAIGVELSEDGYSVRDLWAHSELEFMVGPASGLSLTAMVEGGGGNRLFRLEPLKPSFAV